jgi:hypothetical protein
VPVVHPAARTKQRVAATAKILIIVLFMKNLFPVISGCSRYSG